MDATNHAALVALDQARAAAHEKALAAWRDGPLALWHREALKAREAHKEEPTRPEPPKPPVLVQNAVIGIASTYGITTDDLVRFARKTEVRTPYPEGALDRARKDLGDELCAALLTIAWPDLPAAPKPHPDIPAPEMERVVKITPVPQRPAGPRSEPLESGEAHTAPAQMSPVQSTDEAPSRGRP